MDESKRAAAELIESEQNMFVRLADEIFDHPETLYQENDSASFQKDFLRKLGFHVQETLAGIATAFSGRYGSGKPVIGILGEFDALPGLSQEAGVTVRRPVIPGGCGHGCGHNLLGTASIAAAFAVKKYLEDTGRPGTVIYYGCPAEEGGSGKSFMARDGVFDELDIALAWHPEDANFVMAGSSLANFEVSYHFSGVAAHAAEAPHIGRSALDAVELMNVGVQFLREHVIPETRIHYAITDAGGFSPNVVQPSSDVLYMIRAPKLDQVQETWQRVNDIARGAALMTGTRMEYHFIKACAELVPNHELFGLLQRNLDAMPLPVYTDTERAFATSIQEAVGAAPEPLESRFSYLDSEQIEAIRPYDGQPVYNFVVPAGHREFLTVKSFDVGDVSFVCPTAQFGAATMAAGTPAHSWQLVAQGKSSLAHKGMLYAAKVLAGSAIEAFENPEIIEKAREEHKRRLGGRPFHSPIPPECTPEDVITTVYR